MTIARSYGAGWGVGDKLTSAQLNALDLNVPNALDKRAGQSDTLSSIVSCSGAGRIAPTYLVGADANTTYALSSGISIINASGLTARRVYTLSNTAAVAGDHVVILGNPTYPLQVKNNGGTALFTVGASGDTVGNPIPHSTWAEFFHNGTNWFLLRSSLQGLTTKRMPFRPDAFGGTAIAPAAFSDTTTSLVSISATELTFTTYPRALLHTVQTGATGGYVYRQFLDGLLPQGMTLSSVVMNLVGKTGHAGLPAQMPAFGIFAHAQPGTTNYSLLSTGSGFVTDTAANTAAYEANHTVTFTPNQNNVIDNATQNYALYVIGEGGTNALIDLGINNFVFTFAV